MTETPPVDVRPGEYGAEAPVTGQGRMEAAWGSSEGDEDLSDTQITQPTSTGHVFEQVYKPWQGELNPRWMRNWAILRHHLLGIFNSIVHPRRVPRITKRCCSDPPFGLAR